MIAVAHGEVTRVKEIAEVKRTSVLNFTIKSTVKYGDKEFDRYINCAAWGKRGEDLAGELQEGRYVVVTGEPSAESYMKDNEAKAVLSVSALAVALP